MPRLDTCAVLGASPHGEAVIAVQELAPGTPVFRLTGTLTHLPDTDTIQIGAHTPLLPDGQLWRYLNHSCAPNCRIDFSTWPLVATQAIQGNAELTFNYLTTAWEMVAPFACPCGALNCYAWWQGVNISRWRGKCAWPPSAPPLSAICGARTPRNPRDRANENLCVAALLRRLNV